MTEQPEPVTIPAPEQQISAALVDTPQGQRLAVGIVCLLDPASAKSLAAAITQAANNLSASGLVVANGTVTR